MSQGVRGHSNGELMRIQGKRWKEDKGDVVLVVGKRKVHEVGVSSCLYISIFLIMNMYPCTSVPVHNVLVCYPCRRELSDSQNQLETKTTLSPTGPCPSKPPPQMEPCPQPPLLPSRPQPESKANQPKTPNNAPDPKPIPKRNAAPHSKTTAATTNPTNANPLPSPTPKLPSDAAVPGAPLLPTACTIPFIRSAVATLGPLS